MKKLTFLLFWIGMFCVPALTMQGQSRRLTPELMRRMFPRGVVSPEYNADGSVTLRLQAPQAQKVELNSQMDRTLPMTKDSAGVWSVTLTPAVPDMYPYSFVVDGTQVTDPSCLLIFPNEKFKNSLVDMPAPAEVQQLKKVPHGRVSYTYYHSSSLGFDRPVCIYTPAGYNPQAKKRYPVLYLIHGMTDTYETWFKVGKLNIIMDNLIAEGKAEPMIVVMPYANPNPEMQQRGLKEGVNVVDTKRTTNEMVSEIVPFIEANYRVKADARHRAIAGFSLGGRQALAAGLGRPDLFQWVGGYAPAVFGDEPQTNFQNGVYAQPKVLKKELRLLFLACGKSDFLYGTAQALDQSFTEKEIPHVNFFIDGNHTLMNCRKYITEMAPMLFH